MYRLLIPVDESVERAENQAEFAISFPGATDTVEVVIGHTPVEDDRNPNDDSGEIDRVGAVRAAVEIFEEAGVEYETRELSAPPEVGIFDLTESQSFDAIVMGGRKRSPAEKAILGSVTQKVILNTEIPVVVTGGGPNNAPD